MKSINYIEVPAKEAEDVNRIKSTWHGGRMVAIDEGSTVTLYLGHTEEERFSEEGESRTATLAFPIRLEKPLTKDKAINAAEMEAYGLATPMDVAALNAALSRKWRENMNDKEVSEHDEFIRWVKAELDSTGLFAKSNNRVDTSLPTLSDMLNLSRIVVSKPDMLTDEESLTVKSLYPTFDNLLAKAEPLPVDFKFQYVGKLYKVIQQHTPQADWIPGTDGTKAIYGLVSGSTGEHAGTLEDPIPYERNMVLYEGKYYTQFGEVYLCTRNSIVGYDVDLADPGLASLVEKVE